MPDADLKLGPRHAASKRLRALLRDPAARREQGAFVVEGPRAIEAALERGARLEGAYYGPRAAIAFAALHARLADAGVPGYELKEGVLEKVGTTVTPQPVMAVAAYTPTSVADLARLDPSGPVLVGVSIGDPGNAGTMLRSAEAAGMAGVVFCGESVDARNSKVVRASAGAIFGVPVVEADDPVESLEALGAQGRTRLGTRATGGVPFERAPLDGPVAIVLGNEARGLADDLPLDGVVTIPMAGHAESINVAMAATILCFETARRRRAKEGA